MRILKHVQIRLVLILLLFSSHGLAVNVPDEVVLAAESGLAGMLQAIPEGFENQYGFKNRQEFSGAYTGAPYQLCTIAHEKLNITYRGKDYIETLPIWRFPVICAGRIRSLLTVAEVKGEYQAVEIGAAGLAAEFEKFDRKLSPQDKAKSKKLLRLYQFKSDYLLLVKQSRHPEEGTFYPLQSAVENLGTTKPAAAGISFPELLNRLQEHYEKKKDSLPELNRHY